MDTLDDKTAARRGANTAASTSRKYVGVLIALLALGALPHLGSLKQWPASLDAAIWVVRGNPSADGWLEWVFQTRHFRVAYRPITALSYSLNSALTGWDIGMFRITDLVLHLSAAVGIGCLYRRLAPDLPAWGGLVAIGLFLAHPLTQEVVPHLARRSYSLATVLALAGLLAILTPADLTSRIRALSGGLLLGAGLLANETTVLYAAIVPLALLLARDRSRDSLRRVFGRSAVALVPVAAALVARMLVAEGVGGYRVEVARGERVLPIVWRTWCSLLDVSPEQIGLTAFGVVAAGVLFAYGWVAVIDPLRRPSHPARRPILITFVWLTGYTLMFAPLGVWFPRQMYPALVPCVLLMACALASSVAEITRIRIGWLRLVPQAFLILWLAAHSPLFVGSDQARVSRRRANDAMLRRLYDATLSVEGSATIYMILPFYRGSLAPWALRARSDERRRPRGIRTPAVWVGALLDDRPIQLVHLLSYRQTPGASDSPITLEEYGGLRWLHVRAGAETFAKRSGWRGRTTGHEETIQLDAIEVPRGAEACYIYVDDGTCGELYKLE